MSDDQEEVDLDSLTMEQLNKLRYLDPLHVMTPILNDLRREFPNLNLNTGTSNWAVVASVANTIVALRTKNLSSDDIESVVSKMPYNFYKGLYTSGKVGR